MALIHSKVRLPSSIYEDNYGYTINYYQPMIDYLDRKNKYHQQNCSKLQNINYNHRPPHLPWTNERGLKQYRPSNLVRPYTTNDINTISKSVAAIANENLINRCVNIRSPFSVIKIADASRILKHLPKDTVIERQFEREREHKLREIEFNERERKGLIRLKNIMDSNKEIEISSDLKRAIRGKSANAITAALLAESDRNIRTAKIEEDQFVAETRASHELFKRGLSENRLLHTRHIEIIDDRLIDNLDHRVSSSLVNVKRQLTNLNTKNVEFYAESRCVPNRYKKNLNKNLMPRQFESNFIHTTPKSLNSRPWFKKIPRHNDRITIYTRARLTGPGTNIYSYKHID